MQEIKEKINRSTENLNKILDDISSKKPYSEKIYLIEFNRMLEKERNSYCNYNCNDLQNCNGKEFFSNYYSSNNVIISGINHINHINYIGNSSPSPF